jgi:Apea-like HEPN
VSLEAERLLAALQRPMPEELVDTRNQYTHFGEPGPHVLAPTDLYGRVDRLQLVLEVNLPRDLVVDAALIPRSVAHAYEGRIR